MLVEAYDEYENATSTQHILLHDNAHTARGLVKTWLRPIGHALAE